MTQSSGQVTRAFLVQCTSWRLYFGTDWVRTRWQTTVTAFRIIALASLLKWMIQNKNDFLLKLQHNLSLVVVTNAWTKRPLKWNQLEKYISYQSVKSHIWQVACWLGHFTRKLSIFHVNPFWWRLWHLGNWFARSKSPEKIPWKNKNLEGIWMILKNRKAEQNGPFNYLNIRGVN